MHRDFKIRVSLVVMAAIALLWRLVWSAYADSVPYDDTDPPGGRSGMSVYTDSLTGCQYLHGARGGLTPRMSTSGRGHIGCRGSER